MQDIRHELAKPGVGVIQHWCQEPCYEIVSNVEKFASIKSLTEEEYEAYSNVGFSPPWGSQRRTDVCDLRPIESNETHSLLMRGKSISFPFQKSYSQHTRPLE